MKLKQNANKMKTHDNQQYTQFERTNLPVVEKCQVEHSQYCQDKAKTMVTHK